MGLAVAVYLTVVHYAQGQVPLACASSGLVNCELVTSSAQSTLGPAPVAVLGLVWTAGGLVHLVVVLLFLITVFRVAGCSENRLSRGSRGDFHSERWLQAMSTPPIRST